MEWQPRCVNGQDNATMISFNTSNIQISSQRDSLIHRVPFNYR
jgi:hypothetical protein